MEYNRPPIQTPLPPSIYYCLQPGLPKPQVSVVGKQHPQQHRGAAPLPGGHTVPGPGPGGPASGRSFAAALRNLAKQAGPAAERENEVDSRTGQVSPKQQQQTSQQTQQHQRGAPPPPPPPPPLVRGPSPQSQLTTLQQPSNAISSAVKTSSHEKERQHSVTQEQRSGFQPYRPEEPRVPPPTFPLDYPYHHPHPASLYPPHLQHAYRLEEQLYLERCGLPLFPPYPALYGLMPSPLPLISPSMHDRLKLEEEHRQRELEKEREREREREKERERREKSKRIHQRASPSHHTLPEHISRKVPVQSQANNHPPPPGAVPPQLPPPPPPPQLPVPSQPTPVAMMPQFVRPFEDSFTPSKSSMRPTPPPSQPSASLVPPPPHSAVKHQSPTQQQVQTYSSARLTPNLIEQLPIYQKPPDTVVQNPGINPVSVLQSYTNSIDPVQPSLPPPPPQPQPPPQSLPLTLPPTTCNIVPAINCNLSASIMTTSAAMTTNTTTVYSLPQPPLPPPTPVNQYAPLTSHDVTFPSSTSPHHLPPNLPSNPIIMTTTQSVVTSAATITSVPPMTVVNASSSPVICSSYSSTPIASTSIHSPATASPVMSVTNTALPPMTATTNLINKSASSVQKLSSKQYSNQEIKNLDQDSKRTLLVNDHVGITTSVTAVNNCYPLDVSNLIPTFDSYKSPFENIPPTSGDFLNSVVTTSHSQLVNTIVVPNTATTSVILTASSVPVTTNCSSSDFFKARHHPFPLWDSRGSSSVTTTATKMLSKLDIAEQRRNSEDRFDLDADGDESTPGGYGGFFLTKGPPDKLDAPPRKLHFLAMFGLTTLAKRNELELRKLSRRRAVPPVELAIGEEDCEAETPPLSLPQPNQSPRALQHSSDKLSFMAALGLQSVSRIQRQEREKIWQEVLAERRRRQCVTPLVLYCQESSRVESPPTQVMKWPGVEDLIQAYYNYRHESMTEMKVLREECKRLEDQISEKRSRVAILEYQLEELCSTKESLLRERDGTQQSIDMLTGIVKDMAALTNR